MRYLKISKETAAKYGIQLRGHREVTGGIIVNEKELDNNPHFLHLPNVEAKAAAIGSPLLSDSETKVLV